MNKIRTTAILAVALLLGSAGSAHGGGICFFNCYDNYTDTEYPIVLVHGLLGFDSLAGVYDYWYRIPSELERGGADVHIVQVSPANSTELRGEELLAQVEEIIAITGKARVNLIGHSQGGLTARYVAGVAPELIASVTAVGTPHTGSEVADVVRGLAPPDSFSEEVIAAIIEAFAAVIGLLSGSGGEQDALAALDSLTTAGTAEFNAEFPAGLPAEDCGRGAPRVDGVVYASWGGVRHFTNLLDLSDPLLAGTGLAFGFEANDGLVSRCSTHLGYLVRDNYQLNHLDLINQLIGLSNWFETDPTTIYRQHANRLKGGGL